MLDNNSQWFLRTDPTSIFGPTSIDTLIQWAQQARILPGHEVSKDRNSWIRAESLPELAMDTYIDLGDDRQSGPFNRVAAEALLASGKVPAGARIVRSDDPISENDDDETQEESPVDETETSFKGDFADEDNEQSNTVENTVGSDTATVQNAGTSACLESETVEKLNRQLIEANREKEVLEEQNRQLRASLTVESDKLRDMLAKYESAESRADDAIKNLSSLNTKLIEAENILGTTQTKLNDANLKLVTAEQKMEEYLVRIESIESDCRNLRNENEQLSSRKLALEGDIAKLNHHIADLDALAAEREQQLNDAKSSISEINAQAARKADEFAKTEAELRKNCALSPEAVRKFHEDRQLLYTAAKDSAEKIAQSLEEEFTLLEQLKQLSAQRQHLMLENRRTLLRIHDNAPSDVIKLSISGRESEAQILHLRAQLDNITHTAQREKAFAETRENELLRKIRMLENELAHTSENLIKREAVAARAEIAENSLAERDKELQLERRNRVEEQQNFEVSKSSFLARIEMLEKRLAALGETE